MVQMGTGGAFSQAVCGTTVDPCVGSPMSGTIGTGTSGSVLYSPHYIFGIAFNNRRQFLYTPAELNAMGFTGPGRIDSVGLFYTTANATNTDVSVSRQAKAD